MNQEQNNLNQNNFNPQGSNGIPNNQPLNNNKPKKTTLGLIIGIVIVVIAALFIFKHMNGNNGLTKKLKVSLEENALVCKDKNTCDELKNNIISIKNVDTKFNDKQINAIILGKDGKIYFKTSDDIIKIEGTTKLTDFNYAVEVANAPGDIIVYDDENVYYINGENNTVQKFELTENIAHFIRFQNDSKMSVVDRKGTGLIYYRCDLYDNDSCVNDEDWFYEETKYVKNAKYSGGEAILMNDKLYSNSIVTNELLLEHTGGIESQVILENVDKVWSWDNLKLDNDLIALTKDSKLFFLKTGIFKSHENFEIKFDEKVKNAYYIAGESYGKAVVVGEKNAYIVFLEYNNEGDKYYKAEKIDTVSSYIDNIKGFYSEDRKLYVLLKDGNTYLAKDFLKD